MKISHEDYLKQKLRTRKMELEHLTINHKIAIAVHNTKSEQLAKDIDSIERQLEKQ